MLKVLFLTMVLFFSSQIQADDADFLKQLKELKVELNSQNERIKHLESLLLQSDDSSPSAISIDKFAWHKLNSWNAVRPGMSRLQVESILGKPTKVEVDSIDYVTLYYQGEKSGSGYISGNVQLNSHDRVIYSGINKPVM